MVRFPTRKEFRGPSNIAYRSEYAFTVHARIFLNQSLKEFFSHAPLLKIDYGLWSTVIN